MEEGAGKQCSECGSSHVLATSQLLNYSKELHVCAFHRETVTQTKTDGHSNVPKPQVFLAGLRGGGMGVPTNMTKVDLTIDVDQT